MSFLNVALPSSTLVVAVDPGKVSNRIWLSDGSGMVVEPVSMPVSRDGIAGLERLVLGHGSTRTQLVFAPSETKAARTQLGSGRFKTDDRDCAALTYLARQGAGRAWTDELGVETLRAVVRHRHGLVADRKVLQQRLHDQLNALAPGLSAPAGHGRGLAVEQPSGQAVLACAAVFAGRAPTVRSLQARAPGRFHASDAQYWADRWRGCLPPPHDAPTRAERVGRDLNRFRALQDDIAALEGDLEDLLARTDGQVLTTLPGVAVIRAAGFAAHSLPISRFPAAEHLYPATGLAPAMYQSATVRRRGRISRQGLAEHRDALMGIAWGLSKFSPSFAQRDREYRARGMAPIQARVAVARHACRLTYRLLVTQQPFDEEAYRRGRLSPGR